ncbi:MAG: hypothetical protein VB055_06615 [Oscillospiraceae bacterium]|nr:hypothetical protein [Oscillospiraceae bacterium]
MMKNRFFCLLVAAALLLSGCTIRPSQAVPADTASATESASVSQTESVTGAEITTESRAEPETTTFPETETASETGLPAFPETLSLGSGQAFAYDVTAGAYLAMKGEGERLYPASTTKLLTILTALRYLSPDELVTPGDELTMVLSDSTFAYVNSTHTLTVEMLIEGMLLPSGNDAACALAAAAGRTISGDSTLSGVDSVAVFVQEMNRYAQEIGMTGSHFVTPDGYFDEDHYTTVEDMAKVSLLAAQNDLIRRYCGLAQADVVYASGHTNHWVNTNLMLDPSSVWYNPYVTGLKTGSVSGHCSLICILDKDGREYIAGVFSAPDTTTRYTDMTAIANWLLAD